MLYKSDTQAFWIPELVRGDLEASFLKIKTHDMFWNFCETRLADYVFTE
jgi:hypothetical protein